MNGLLRPRCNVQFTGGDPNDRGASVEGHRAEHSRGRSVKRNVAVSMATSPSWSMSASTHRGFTFQPYRPDGSPTDKRALQATRGRITLFVEVTAGELPSGWHLRDVLRYEINRLMDPATLRHVDHLN